MKNNETEIFNKVDSVMEGIKRFILEDSYSIESIEKDLERLSICHIKYVLCYLFNAYKNNNEHVITQKVMDNVLSSLDTERKIINNYIEKNGYPDYLKDSLVLEPMRILAIKLKHGTNSEPGESIVLIKEDIDISPEEIIFCPIKGTSSFQSYKRFIIDSESLLRINKLENNLNNTVIVDLMKRLSENPEGFYPLINYNRVLSYKKNENLYEEYEKGLIELLENHINLSKIKRGLENFEVVYRSLSSVISDLCKEKLKKIIASKSLVINKEYVKDDKVSFDINLEMFINKAVLRSSIGLNHENEVILDMKMAKIDKNHGGLLMSKLKEIKTSGEIIDKKYIERTITQIGELLICNENLKRLKEIGCDIFLNNKELNENYVYASNDINNYEGAYELDKPYIINIKIPENFEGIFIKVLELMTYPDENYKREAITTLIEKELMQQDLKNNVSSKRNKVKKF